LVQVLLKISSTYLCLKDLSWFYIWPRKKKCISDLILKQIVKFTCIFLRYFVYSLLYIFSVMN
jgi:hypothetical protein